MMNKITQIFILLSSVLFMPLNSVADLPDYVETDIWNDSHPIYDTEFYNGMMYAVQLYQNSNKSKWEMRLIELKPEGNATLSDQRHWKLDDGSRKLDYYDGDFYNFNASMEEFNGILYIYIYCNSQNYFFAFQTDSYGTATLTSLPCPVENTRCYAFTMTKYRDALAIFYKTTGATIDVVYTRNNPVIQKAEWINKRNLLIDYSNKNRSFGDYDFAVTNWIGVRVGDMNGEKKKLMNEELVFVCYNKSAGTFRVVHYTGEMEDIEKNSLGLWEFPEKSKPILSNSADYGSAMALKLVTGHIKGVGNWNVVDDINVPIQCIMTVRLCYNTGQIHQRQILCYEYDPATYKFHKNTNNDTYNFATNLPYGKFGACSVSVPIPGTVNEDGGIETTTYQRYICILRGAIDSHFNNRHHYAMLKSDQVKVKRCVAKTDSLLYSEEGRKACNLIGVIEGAPPTVVDNPEMYDAMSGFVSSISFGSSDSQLVKTESATSWGHSNVGGFDNYGSSFTSFSIMGGGGYEVTKTKAEERAFKSSYSTSLLNSSADMAHKGYYIYQVPQLDQYVGQMYSPDGSRRLTGCGDLLTFVQTGALNALVEYRLDNPDMDGNLSVNEPLKLESWMERHSLLFNQYSDTGRPFYNQYILSTTGNVSSLESTLTNSSTSSKKMSWKLMVNTHFYKNESGGDVTNTSSTNTSVGKDVSISINSIRREDLALQQREKPVSYYVLQGYFLSNDKPSGLYNQYIADLTKRYIMDENDRPFIIAWDVLEMGDIQFLPAGVEGIEGNKCVSVTGCPGGLKMDCDGDCHIEVYSISGVKVTSIACQQGENRIDLPSGIYILYDGNKTLKATAY